MGKLAGEGSGALYVREIAITGGASSTGVIASLTNSDAGFVGKDIIVTRAALRVTTASTGASTLDIGITATSATTSSDTLLDGISAAATGFFDSADGTDNGTNGTAKPVLWAKDSYLTIAEASGNVDGLVATLYVYFHVA